MKSFFCITLLALGISTARSSGFDKVLQFPRDVSINNYVILNPVDFSDVQDEISICGWVKFFRTDGARFWFSYATAGGDNQIICGDRVTYQYFLGDTMPGSSEDFSTYDWHHTCWTWSSASQLEELYYDGEKVSQETTPSGSKVPTGGSLVLGQEQDSLGGGFVISQAFGGELYQLQIKKRKLSAQEVWGLYEAGICDYPAPSQDTLLDWEDFLDAQRYGEVKEASAGCNRWDIILHDFVGQEITPALIAHLKRHHYFE